MKDCEITYIWLLECARYLIEPNIITEMRVVIQLCITSVGRSSALDITSKDVNNSVLYFFRNGHKIHVISTTRGAFDLDTQISRITSQKMACAYLQIIAIILIKPLQTLYEQEVRGQP